MEGQESIQWTSMLIGLLGGLSLFLYGIGKLSDSLQTVAGKKLKSWLASITRTRYLGACSGAAVTAVIQSSSVTTVLVVGLVSAGLMSTTQSIGVIMGANVGTTITAQIVAFKVTKAALFFVALGFGCWFFGKDEKFKAYGSVMLGLGLIFLGMNLMSDAMLPLRSFQPFLDFMASMSNVFLGILVAALFTALVQSSSATTAIVIVMASQGFVTLETGIAFALGANIGTCVTAMLASLGKSIEARRAAMIHVLFNITGALIWLPIIGYLAALSVWVSPEAPGLSGAERLAVEAPRQIANANTLFNLINACVFLPFAYYFGRLTEMLLPEKVTQETEIVTAKYLDKELVSTPALALARVRLEVAHMGQIVTTMMARFSRIVGTKDLNKINQVCIQDDQVDVLQEKLLSYMAGIRRHELSQEQEQEFMQLMAVIDHIEHVGDDLSVGLARVARKFVEFDIEVSEETQEDFRRLFEQLEIAFVYAIRAVTIEDQKAAQEVLMMSDTVDSAISNVLDRQMEKLDLSSNRSVIFRVEMAFCEQARHIYSLSRRIAIQVLPKSIAPDA